MIVNELPVDGQPENFQGLVGDYALKQSLKKTQVITLIL